MAKKEVTVAINGEESVSRATKQAEAGLTGFAGFLQQFKGKLIPVIDVTKLVEMAVRALSAAFNAAKQFVADSIGAYDAYTTAQVKLNAQSKLTGMSMREMNALVEIARSKFGLGAVAAVDITAAVAKFASQAGQSGRAAELMAAALELGAASGQNAAQVAEGLSSALAGNDEWLNKLGLANPSGLYEDFAAALGTTGSKLDDTQKKLAIMTAIMDAGNKVTGVYAERLASGAGAQEQLNNRLDTAKTMFGAAIQPIRIFVIEGLTAILNVIGPLVIAFGYLASGLLQSVIAPFRLAQSAIGSVVEVVGRLTGNKTLEAWGKQNAQAFVKFTDDLGKWMGVAKPATAQTTEMGKAHELAAVKITASRDATDKHAESTKRAKTEHETLKVALGMTQGALQRLGQAAKDQLPPKPAQDFNAAIESIRRGSDEIAVKMRTVGDESLRSSTNTKEMAREIETTARGAIDAAGAFGVIDEKAQRSLNSAVSIASAVGNMAKNGFSFAGAVGIIGGVASIVSTMMSGDGDRKRLMRENNQRLAEVRDGLAEFTLEISGGDQETLTDILTEGLADGPFTGSSQLPALLSWLKDKGFSETRLDSIAKDLGINIRDKNGNIFYDGLVALLTALMGTNKGPRKNFGNDLSAIEDSFAVNQTDTIGQVKQLGDLGGQYSDLFKGMVDINDLSGTRTRLRQLFADFQAGKISLKDMGGMSRSQFQSFLTMLIGRVDQAIGSGATAPPTGSSSTDVGGGTSSLVVGGGAPAVTAETVQTVIKAMNTNLAGILTTHTAIHERIAVATEGSYERLTSIDAKMDTLIAVSGGVDRLDRALEADRYALAVQQGVGASF